MRLVMRGQLFAMTMALLVAGCPRTHADPTSAPSETAPRKNATKAGVKSGSARETQASSQEHTSAPLAEILRCRKPWACELTEDLRGASMAEVRERFGEPYWSGPDETVWLVGGSCLGESQYVSVQDEAGKVLDASFDWHLAYTDCSSEVASYRPLDAPIDVPCPLTATACPAIEALEGMSEDGLVQALGLPHGVDGNLWSYVYPRGCTDERNVLSIDVHEGKARAVRWEHEYTGQHCEPIE